MRQFIYRFTAMTTPCELILFSEDKTLSDGVADLILKEAKRLEMKYSYYREDSVLSKLNARTETKLDSETKTLLERAKKYYTLTEGIFDITVATFKPLYTKEHDEASLLRAKEELLPFVGCEHFKIKKERLSFDNPHTTIDLGGFVKEYAVDRAAMIAKKSKIAAALINFGGDIYAYGLKPDNTPFRIGIKDPNDPSQHATSVELNNKAIATSASYERNYQIGATNFSHIFSKSATEVQAQSVSVIAKNCVECGVFATALMINPELKTPYRTIIL